MNNYRLKLTILCLTFIFASENKKQSDYFSEKNIISYANHLLETKAYKSALREYQRALYSSENSEIKNNLIIQIAYCYWKLDNINQSIIFYRKALNQIHSKKRISEINLQLAIIYLLDKQIDISLETIKKITINHLNPEDKNKTILIEAGVHILNSDFDIAISLLQLENIKNNPKTKILLKLINKRKLKKEKNGLLATFFSSIIPGGGKIYLNNYGDGVYSFIYTGLTIYMTYNSMNNENKFSLKSFIYGGLGLTLYTGNIYGTYIAAKQYNKNLYENLYENIIETLEI